MKRRSFLSAAGVGSLALACGKPKEDEGSKDKSSIETPLPSFSVSENEGKLFWGPGGDKYQFLVTGDQSGETTFILHATVPPGGGPPPHTHTRESESYFVKSGELLFSVGDNKIEAKAGDFVHIPKNTIHTFTNKGSINAQMLSIFAPSGMEGWFEEVLVPVKEGDSVPHEYTKEELDKMIEAGPKHGVKWVLPS